MPLISVSNTGAAAVFSSDGALISASSVVGVISMAASVFQWIIIIHIIISWIPQLRASQLGYFFSVLSEPILMPIRKLIERSPLVRSPLDLSVVFAYLFIEIIAVLLKGAVVWLMG